MGFTIRKTIQVSYFVIFACLCPSLAQVSQVEYGKNRIQYHDDFDQWLLYESENFITYWYGKARNHGVSTVKYAEQDHDEILDIIEHRINDKIEIIVFSDVSDLKQSNIGHEETFHTILNQTKIEGSKVFVYFDGDHESLRRQIRKGVAQVFLNSMFYGNNLQEVVQNSVSGTVPTWFQSGLAEYIGSYWDYENDTELRNIFLSERKTSFKRLHGFYPRIIGHSLWYYIGLTYGRSEISNLLYLTRINRSIEDAFLYVFGIPFDDITEQWESYFLKRYQSELEQFNEVDPNNEVVYKRKKRVPTTSIRYSPQGDRVALVDNQISKTRITLKDLTTGDARKIFKHGFKNNEQATDYDYPIVEWLPDGSGLFILFEHRDKITLRLIDFNEGTSVEQVLPERYERVFSMAALSEGELIFSALSEGMVDLFYYTTNTRQSTQLTDDIYDDIDIDVGTIEDIDGIVFSSNRPDTKASSSSVDTILPFSNFNLFLLALEEEAPVLYQLTDVEVGELRGPRISGSEVQYISNENGVANRKELSLQRTAEPRKKIILEGGIERIFEPGEEIPFNDTLILDTRDTNVIAYQTVSSFQSNHLRNIEVYDLNHATDRVIEGFMIGDRMKLYESTLSGNEPDSVSSLHLQILDRAGEEKRKANRPQLPSTQRPREEVIREASEEGKKYLFQSEFADMEEDKAEDLLEEAATDIIVPTTSVQVNKQTSTDSTAINRLRIVPYQLKFKMHSLSTNMDNSLLFGGLDSYAAFKREFEPQPLGILLKANFKDLFEDYVFEGGVRIPTSFNGAEFFLVHDDRKNRLDKRYALYRKTSVENTSTESGESIRNRNTILLGQYGLKYPLDIYNSIRATATLRQDKITFLASDQQSLGRNDLESQRIGIRLEYVFDNSLDIDLNIRSGTRFKVYTELVKKFAFSIDPLTLKLNEGFMTVLGTDARHYFNFAKHSVLAGRFSAGTSFGSERILYFLGGVDNALIPKFNNDIPQPPGDDFAFRTINPNLRGFDYNIRNGSTFALFNAELRIPFLKYLSRRPIKISFFRHLQLVGFADVGAAWEGLNPFDDENPINIVHLSNPPTVRLKVNYYRDPLVVGYGVGVRTMLFGYFIRLDYAWGVETRLVQKPKLHLALGLDF